MDPNRPRRSFDVPQSQASNDNPPRLDLSYPSTSLSGALGGAATDSDATPGPALPHSPAPIPTVPTTQNQPYAASAEPHEQSSRSETLPRGSSAHISPSSVRYADDSDREGGSTSSHPLPPVPAEIHGFSSASVPTLTPMPTAFGSRSSRRDTVMVDTSSGTHRTLEPTPYSTVSSAPRNSRRMSVGPGQSGSVSRNTDRRTSVRPLLARSGTGTEVDWIVPVEEKVPREKTVGDRLEPTLLNAIAEKDRYSFKARFTGYALNIAIGLQVLLGALTTGLSVVTTGKQTSIMTAILGGLATVVASYLARARGSNEPELSITRVKDLEQFIRECEAFRMDHGHEIGDKYDKELEGFRNRFEELLGNGNGERKLSV